RSASLVIPRRFSTEAHRSNDLSHRTSWRNAGRSARKPSAAGDAGASWRVPSAGLDHVCVAHRVPPTRYAQSAGAKIPFQASGEGRCDLGFVPGLVSHLDLQWQQPSYRRFVTALEHACRVIRFDKRGTGLSDPTDALPGMDERVADLATVMDAAGSQAAVV